MKNYGEVIENIDLKKYNTYGIGGHAKYLISPDSVEHLQALIAHLKENGIPWYILGSGSNVILPDNDFAGVIIRLTNFAEYKAQNDIITAGSGLALGALVKKMLDDGYTNYANLMGIPGLLGGAIIGNAGAYNTCIFDYLISVTLLDKDGNIQTLNREDIIYDYRYTEFKGSDKIILEAKLEGIKGNVAEAKENIAINLEKRQKTQPLEYKNAGSVFKNPPGLSAGYMIEHAGLKKTTVGGAQVSEKHANFIINYKNATSHDIIELIELIRNKVQIQYKVKLELEQVQVIW